MSHKKSYKYKYLRRPRTHQEMVANIEYKEDDKRIKWGRERRNTWLLDPWNFDKTHTIQKSWKKKRKTQYYEDGRRKKAVCHTVIFQDGAWSKKWNFMQFLEKHNIPYTIKRLNSHKPYNTQYIIRFWQYKRLHYKGYL